MGKRKRNTDQSSDASEPSEKCPSRTCVLHMHKVPDDNPFTSFSSVKCVPSEKLSYLLEIRDRRRAEPTDSSHHMKDVCDLLPESLDGLDLERTGYHRCCYQNFAAHLDRLKRSAADASSVASTSQRHHSPRKKKSTDVDHVKFPSHECIFCEKNEIKIKGKTQRPTRSFTAWKKKESGWKKIEPMAEALGNTHLCRKVKGMDLFAAEAHYHDSCYHRFFSDYNNLKQKLEKKNEFDTDQARKIAAHNAAYNVVKELLKTKVINNQQVLPLSTIRDHYAHELDVLGAPNPNYRSIKLKAKLEKDEKLGECLSFSKVSLKEQGCFSFWLVYSANISLADAIACAYRLGTADRLKDTGLYLRQVIQKAFEESSDLSWPPTADELDMRAKIELPEELKEFLNIVLSGSGQEVEKCERTRRLVYSIGQDLCRAVTNGQWKLSKHIFLCTTVRHLYRSKLLTRILNRLGHCESYDFG